MSDVVPGENYFEWEVKPPDGASERMIEFFASLRELLEPYVPAKTITESTHQFSTNELLQALEMHYGLAQGDVDSFGIGGEALVDYLKANGWVAKNTGGLQLEWLMKARSVSPHDDL